MEDYGGQGKNCWKYTGVCQNFRKKRGFSGDPMQKKCKNFRRVMVKSTRSPGGQIQKKGATLSLLTTSSLHMNCLYYRVAMNQVPTALSTTIT